MSPREPPGRDGRINLADPKTAGPRGDSRGIARRRRIGRLLRLLGVTAALGIFVLGLFIGRGPIGSGLASAGDGIGDAAGVAAENWRGWSHALQDLAEAVDATTTTTVAAEDPARSSSVLLVAGSDRSDAAFALAARSPADEVSLIILPQTLLVLAPGYGEFTLSEVLEFGGTEMVETAIANEMGIRIDEVLPLPDGLAPMADELVVDVPVALSTEGEDGGRRLIAAGRQRLSMDLVDLLLTAPGEEDQFDWLRRQAAVWGAVLEGIAADGEAADRLVAAGSGPPEAVDLLRQLGVSPEVSTPPVDRVAISATRDALDFTGRAWVVEELGHLLLRTGNRPRAEVLNGTGVTGAAAPVAGMLIEGGFWVIRTGNAAAFDHQVTQVIAQGAPAEAAAEEARDLLGTGQVLLELRAPSGVVDVSIIVGTDMPPGEG